MTDTFVWNYWFFLKNISLYILHINIYEWSMKLITSICAQTNTVLYNVNIVLTHGKQQQQKPIYFIGSSKRSIDGVNKNKYKRPNTHI